MMVRWRLPIRLSEVHGAKTYNLAPDATERAGVAKQLGLLSLPTLAAEVTVRPWLDGAEIVGRFAAVVEQESAVSLEAFEQPLDGAIEVRVVPAGSANAVPASGELELDPDAPDPPDVLDTDVIDLAAYVIEHLALEIDPFARKPGEAFAFDAPPEPDSPFAVLKKLKGEGP